LAHVHGEILNYAILKIHAHHVGPLRIQHLSNRGRFLTKQSYECLSRATKRCVLAEIKAISRSVHPERRPWIGRTIRMLLDHKTALGLLTRIGMARLIKLPGLAQRRQRLNLSERAGAADPSSPRSAP
jgi:hypothetical protein